MPTSPSNWFPLIINMLFGITLSLSLQITISLVAIFNTEDVPLAPTPIKKRDMPKPQISKSCGCDLTGNRAFADTVKDPEWRELDLEWTP